MIFLLDNGHGIETPYKRSPIWADGSQLFEWEFNRDIVRRIKEKCDKIGINAMIVVAEDADISLMERCRRVNAFHSKCGDAVLLSIHANAGGGTGFEVYTSPGQTKADAIATKFIEGFKRDFPDIKMRTDMTDGDPDKEAGFYILKHTTCPAILLENLFMDYEPDCRLLMSAEFRDKLAESYVNTIKTL